MTVGPIVIFDKSAFQSLNVDEAVWFGQFYRANITPLFFVETLADLEKEVREGRTPEQVVGSLAHKTSALTADPNVHHSVMALQDLIGNRIEMRGVVVMAGGRPVVTGDHSGIVFKQSPEHEALQRWERGEFLAVEREFARGWRRALASLNLEASYQRFKPLIDGIGRPRDLTEVKVVANELLSVGHDSDLDIFLAFAVLGIDPDAQRWIFGRWLETGSRSLATFAPYAAHVVKVELFFHLALSSDLISRDRPSNKADMAYLYYLPFCMVFTSSDKLHERTVPLFLNDHQAFVRGQDLKTDLRRLDEHYLELPEEVRSQGIMSFAKDPPEQGDFLVSSLWDRFLPRWRAIKAERGQREEMSPEAERELVQRFTPEAAGQRAPSDVHVDDADFVVIERVMPVRMGKWRILPPGIEDRQPK